MNILLIHNKYQQAGGEDFVFESEAELLLQHGHHVDKLVFDNKDINTRTDKILSGLRIFYSPGSAKRLQERISQSKPDIVHVHNFVPIASPSIFYVAKRNRIPVVATLHNYRLICPSATLFFEHKIYEKSLHSIFPLDAILKGVYRNSKFQTAVLATMTTVHNLIGTWRHKIDKFIVLTEFAKSKFMNSALRVSKDQFLLKPNFVADPGEGELTRDDYFLFVGRLSEEKGIDTLLEAAEIHNFKLTIIGDGPMREKVEIAVRSNPNVNYLGFQKKNVIFEKLKRCKALLFPSIWFEGFPITILEAFATGTPIIASRIGGLAEIIQNNFNGLHFEPGNANGLVSRIKEINDTALARTLSTNCRMTYSNYYTPEKNYLILMEIYKKALGSNLENR